MAKAKYRFYRGEARCPFDDDDSVQFTFWWLERQHSMEDADIQAANVKSLERFLASGSPVDKELARKDKPIEERAVLYYIARHMAVHAPMEKVDLAAYFRE